MVNNMKQVQVSGELIIEYMNLQNINGSKILVTHIALLSQKTTKVEMFILSFENFRCKRC